MKLTWRDGVTTLLAAAILGIYYAEARGIDLPLIEGTRTMIATTGFLTFIMGIIGMEGRDVEEPGWLTVLALLGVATAGVFVVGLFQATTGMLLAVTVGALAMWGVGMLHHTVSESDAKEALCG